MQPTSSDLTDATVKDRADLPRSFLGTAWPLAAVALVLLMLLRACVPAIAPQSSQPAAAKRADGSAAGAVAPARRPDLPPAPR
jgi:hypothetical protein